MLRKAPLRHPFCSSARCSVRKLHVRTHAAPSCHVCAETGACAEGDEGARLHVQWFHFSCLWLHLCGAMTSAVAPRTWEYYQTVRSSTAGSALSLGRQNGFFVLSLCVSVSGSFTSLSARRTHVQGGRLDAVS